MTRDLPEAKKTTTMLYFYICPLKIKMYTCGAYVRLRFTKKNIGKCRSLFHLVYTFIIFAKRDAGAFYILRWGRNWQFSLISILLMCIRHPLSLLCSGESEALYTRCFNLCVWAVAIVTAMEHTWFQRGNYVSYAIRVVWMFIVSNLLCDARKYIIQQSVAMDQTMLCFLTCLTLFI